MSWRELFLVVELSAMWQMDELRDLAIEKIILLPMDTSEWVAALKLSTLQFVTKIRDTAIDHLTPTDCLPLMDKISLAVESRVADWLLSCLKEIVVRNETISLEEQEQLGVDMTLRLFRIRDRCHRNLYGASYPDADVALRTEFEGELNASEYTHGSYMSLKPASRPENRKGEYLCVSCFSIFSYIAQGGRGFCNVHFYIYVL
jgi:hypothetical protein